MKNKYTKDKGSDLKFSIDETTGFLTAPVSLARVGLQKYYGVELGIMDRKFDLITVFRSPEEVFNPDSLKSFTNLVSTDDHPDYLVTVNNVKGLQVGQVSEITVDEDNGLIDGVLTIVDAESIQKVISGKKEVSVGYTHNLVKKDGEYNGEKYEYIQTDIRANHLAIVAAGRCGSACSISMDNTGDQSMKVTIGGITFDTDNAPLAQAIEKLTADHVVEVNALKKEVEGKDKAVVVAIAAKDAAEAKADLADKAVLTDADISTLVSARATLLADAVGVLGDKMPECKDCPIEIKAAVIDAVTGVDVSGKSTDYVDAAYDMAMAQHKVGVKNQDNLKNDFKKMGKDNMTVDQGRAAARSKYLKSKGLEG